MRLSTTQIRQLSPENQIRAVLRGAIEVEKGLPVGMFFSSAPRISNEGGDPGDCWIPRFPGDGAIWQNRQDRAKAINGGFLLSTHTYQEASGGCIAVTVPYRNVKRFVVSWGEHLIEVSLCLKEQFGRPQNGTKVILVFQIPEQREHFHGVGACFLPGSAHFPFSWLVNKFLLGAMWHCPLRFREIEEQDENEADGMNLEVFTAPPEGEDRELAILCGKFCAKCYSWSFE